MNNFELIIGTITVQGSLDDPVDDVVARVDAAVDDCSEVPDHAEVSIPRNGMADMKFRNLGKIVVKGEQDLGHMCGVSVTSRAFNDRLSVKVPPQSKLAVAVAYRLAIAARWCELYGGRIKLSSTPFKPSSFDLVTVSCAPILGVEGRPELPDPALDESGGSDSTSAPQWAAPDV